MEASQKVLIPKTTTVNTSVVQRKLQLNSKLGKKSVVKKVADTLSSLNMLSLVHGDFAHTLHSKESQTTQTSSFKVKSRYQKKFETLKEKLDQISSGSETETIQSKQVKARAKMIGNYYRPLRKKSVVLLGTP